MKILVAMSGGVDSSVVAHLLHEQGHELIGVRFTLWSDPLAPPIAQILPSKCCNAQTVARARQVAEDLGIELKTLDLEEEFKKEVVDPFLDGYREGKTPNPCIGCNKTVKFGRLLEYVEELGCEALATGHYARTAKDASTGKMLLLEAVDKQKDQSYYLYGLNQEQLSKVLFPLGSMQKSEVFALAKKYSVPLPEHYQESQDLCFFPEKEPHDFLDRYIEKREGEIVDTNGKTRGAHRGLHHYTEGQRKGLGIGGLQIPLHVVRKEPESNRVVVGTKEEASSYELSAHNLNWISWDPTEHEVHEFEARINSLGRRHRGSLQKNGDSLTFRFQTPVLGISPGQSIVLYRGEEVVGGGVISPFLPVSSARAPLRSSIPR